ncbi:unnamed protein product, partial [Ceratitis capitata]
MEDKLPEEQLNENRVQVGGLNLFDSNRRIDTGIPHPVDFIPMDYLNRCAARIFGTTGQESHHTTYRITDELSVSEENNSLTFSRKIEELFDKS